MNRRLALFVPLLLGLTFSIFSVATSLATSSVTCSSPPSDPPVATEYFVSLADPGNHIAHVAVRLRQGEGRRLLDMPVWNALYQVRNFATNVMNVRAQDASGAPVEVDNRRTSEWELTAPPGCVVVSYDVRLDTAGPFGSQLGADHAFFNWAMVLMYAPDLRSQPVSLKLLDVPSTWALRDLHVMGGAAPGKVEQVTGTAHNYDELADSPAQLGTFQQTEFRQDGATYHIVVEGNPADYDMATLATNLGKITHAAVTWMQDRPYDEYTFLYDFPHGHGAGGMEHAFGTAIDLNGDRLRNDPTAIAGVSAHEFFHLWNVKRIRPQSLEPVDYQHEQDTRALWFCEGVTSTVADLLLVRSGLIGETAYLQRMAAEIMELQGRPAHLWQSAEESSLDAWFEGNAFYRSPQRSISYYNKGDILGILLDLRIRQLTGGAKSLRDLFQWMNEHYAKQHRFYAGSEGIEQAAEAVAGQSFAGFFRDYVAGVKELPYDDFFGFVGLRLGTRKVQVAESGFRSTTNLGGQPEVIEVQPNGEAQRAGIAVGDRVTAVNDLPAEGFLDEELAQQLPGTLVRLRIENRRGSREVKLKLGAGEQQIYELQDLSTVTPAQRVHREAWIHGDDESGGAG